MPGSTAWLIISLFNASFLLFFDQIMIPIFVYLLRLGFFLSVAELLAGLLSDQRNLLKTEDRPCVGLERAHVMHCKKLLFKHYEQ